jgi:hypothetical protein
LGTLLGCSNSSNYRFDHCRQDNSTPLPKNIYFRAETAILPGFEVAKYSRLGTQIYLSAGR